MNRDHTGSILQLPLVFTPRANKGFNGASRTPFKRLPTTPQCSIPCKLNSWASTLACPKQGSLAGSSLIRPSVGSAWCECLGEWTRAGASQRTAAFRSPSSNPRLRAGHRLRQSFMLPAGWESAAGPQPPTRRTCLNLHLVLCYWKYIYSLSVSKD